MLFYSWAKNFCMEYWFDNFNRLHINFNRFSYIILLFVNFRIWEVEIATAYVAATRQYRWVHHFLNYKPLSWLYVCLCLLCIQIISSIVLYWLGHLYKKVCIRFKRVADPSQEKRPKIKKPSLHSINHKSYTIICSQRLNAQLIVLINNHE